MRDPDCLFCKIIQGEIPARKVFETEFSLAFLDIAPVTEGHVVLIPKNHYSNLLDIPDSEIEHFFKDLKYLAHYMKDKLNMEGFNIIQNNFSSAGQIIPHFHYHIWPRNKGDELNRIQKSPKLASEEKLNEIWNKFK